MLGGAQPGADGGDERLDACLECGVDDGCEARAVIGRQLVQRSGLLGVPVGVGVGAAHGPEDGRGLWQFLRWPAQPWSSARPGLVRTASVFPIAGAALCFAIRLAGIRWDVDVPTARSRANDV